MGGPDSIRGYLIQAMVLILDTLQNDNPWYEVTLEPKHESEKVDIKWVFEDSVRVVQVKSSINVFEKKAVEKWSMELRNFALADEYELTLVGTPSQPVIELMKTGCGGVKISSRNLDFDGMTKQIAHDIDIFCERKGIPSRTPSSREILAKALVTEFEKYATESKVVERTVFENLLSKWIFLLLPQLSTSNATYAILSSRPDYPLEAWYQPLLLKKDGVSDSLHSFLIHGHRNKIAVVGKSGGGKSSLIKMAANEINQNTPYTAFWIPLLYYTVDLSTTIKRFLGWFDLPTERVVRTLQENHIILFLDGLNEVSREFRDSCASEIAQLISTYEGKLCISLLLSDNELYDFGVETFEVPLLDEPEIKKAVTAYFDSNQGKARFLLDLIGETRHNENGLFVLIQTPMHLGFFLELAENDHFENKTYNDLYSDVIEKRLTRNSQHGKKGEIHINQRIDLLMNLAYRSFIEDRGLVMSMVFIRDTFSNKYQMDIDLALDEIIQSDILLRVSNSEVVWFHQSFRDYFAGRYLANLAETDKSLSEFPFHESRAISAIAHAVRISTKSSDLKRRWKVYLSFLESNPSFDLIRTVSIEYGWSNMLGDNKTLEEAENDYKQYEWGERFLYVYQLLLKAVAQENPSAVNVLPSPRGLTVFFDSKIEFCLMLFSEDSEIRFERLEMLENSVFQIIKEKKACIGFCLYAPFLYLLDPEILAYLEVEVLIKLLKINFDQTKVYRSYPELPITPRDYINWKQMKVPLLVSGTGNTVLNQVPLDWDDFYNPVTFQINPDQTKSRRLHSRSYSISLGLLLPFTSRNWYKIDLPNKIYIPFPIHLLNGWYFPDTISLEQSQGRLANQFTQFVHLEKII